MTAVTKIAPPYVRGDSSRRSRSSSGLSARRGNGTCVTWRRCQLHAGNIQWHMSMTAQQTGGKEKVTARKTDDTAQVKKIRGFAASAVHPLGARGNVLFLFGWKETLP